MQRKQPKSRCEKRKVGKADLPCKLYSPIMSRYLDVLDNDPSIASIQCNKLMEGLTLGDFTSDFFCVKTDGSYMVRECVDRRHLTKPQTVSMLDASRSFWHGRGVTDWGVVINKDGSDA